MSDMYSRTYNGSKQLREAPIGRIARTARSMDASTVLNELLWSPVWAHTARTVTRASSIIGSGPSDFIALMSLLTNTNFIFVVIMLQHDKIGITVLIKFQVAM